MKIVFFGSDDFAVVHLKKLFASKHDIQAVVCPPDKAKGRGMKIGFSPVKALAGERGCPVLQPDDLKDESFIDQMRQYESDLFIVIAYGKFLPQALLDIPKIFSVNVHGSLLPKYRGAAPINWAIIEGRDQTGVSIIKMNARMDAGELLAQKSLMISKADTSVALRARMADMGAELLVETLDKIENREHTEVPQDEKEVTYAAKLTKGLGLITWEKTALEIHDLVRGLLPWPAAIAFLGGKRLKILQTEVPVSTEFCGQPGEIVGFSDEGFFVATGDGSLLIKEVHMESSKAMDAKSFCAGHKVLIGDRFSLESC